MEDDLTKQLHEFVNDKVAGGAKREDVIADLASHSDPRLQAYAKDYGNPTKKQDVAEIKQATSDAGAAIIPSQVKEYAPYAGAAVATGLGYGAYKAGQATGKTSETPQITPEADAHIQSLRALELDKRKAEIELLNAKAQKYLQAKPTSPTAAVPPAPSTSVESSALPQQNLTLEEVQQRLSTLPKTTLNVPGNVPVPAGLPGQVQMPSNMTAVYGGAAPPAGSAAAVAPAAPSIPPAPTTPSDPRAAFLQKAQEIQGQAVVPPAGGARRNPAQLAEFKVEEPLNKGVNQLVYSSGANKPNVPETEFRDFRNAAIDEVYGGQPPASQGGSVKNQKQLTNWIETNKERFPNVWNNYQAIKDKFPTQGGSASLGMLLNLVGLSGLAVEGVKASKSGDWSNFGLGAVNQAVSNIAPRASLPTALITYSKSAGETPEELKALGERLKYAQKVGYGRGSQGVPPP